MWKFEDNGNLAPGFDDESSEEYVRTAPSSKARKEPTSEDLNRMHWKREIFGASPEQNDNYMRWFRSLTPEEQEIEEEYIYQKFKDL